MPKKRKDGEESSRWPIMVALLVVTAIRGREVEAAVVEHKIGKCLSHG